MTSGKQLEDRQHGPCHPSTRFGPHHPSTSPWATSTKRITQADVAQAGQLGRVHPTPPFFWQLQVRQASSETSVFPPHPPQLGSHAMFEQLVPSPRAGQKSPESPGATWMDSPGSWGYPGSPCLPRHDQTSGASSCCSELPERVRQLASRLLEMIQSFRSESSN
jgi:hypothetical protein